MFVLKFGISDADPTQQFMNKQNRELMHSLTAMEIDRVFRERPKPIRRPTYRFLTADEVKAKFKGALRTANRLLLMPPILPIEEDNIRIVSNDPELQGHTDSKMVFIDTSFDVKDRERTALVRQPNGVLETADQITKRRLIETYFPFKGRNIIVPRMFSDEHLQRILDDGKYEFVLNRCIIQFEPYEKDYHRVTSLTYQHINEKMAFDGLRSTRHFGPMAFFLAWHKLIDNLIIDCIERDLLRNAVEAICLMYNLNKIPYDAFILEQLKQYPKRDSQYFYAKLIESNANNLQLDIENAAKNADDFKCDEICLQFLDEFQKSEYCCKANEIKATIHTYREQAKEKRRLFDGLQKAHGVN